MPAEKGLFAGVPWDDAEEQAAPEQGADRGHFAGLSWDSSHGIGKTVADVQGGLTVGVGQTINSLGSAIATGLMPDDVAAREVPKLNDFTNIIVNAGQQARSDTYNADEQALAKAKQDAGQQGGLRGALGEAAATIKGLTANHGELLAGGVTEQVPQLGLSLLTGGAGRAAALKAGLGEIEAAKVGAGVAMGSGAALQGGDVAGDTFQRIQQLPEATLMASDDYRRRLEQGMTPSQARADLAAHLSKQAGAAGTAISLLTMSALPGAEKMAFGQGLGKGIVGGVVKGAIGEGVQETLEEGGGALATNAAVKEVDPSQPLGQGVVAQGIHGGVLGAAMGGAVGGTHHDGHAAADEEPVVPVAEDYQAQAADQVAAKPVPTDPTLLSPDGNVVGGEQPAPVDDGSVIGKLREAASVEGKPAKTDAYVAGLAAKVEKGLKGDVEGLRTYIAQQEEQLETSSASPAQYGKKAAMLSAARKMVDEVSPPLDRDVALGKVLADPKTTNPAVDFDMELRRQGIDDRTLTPEEQAQIAAWKPPVVEEPAPAVAEKPKAPKAPKKAAPVAAVETKAAKPNAAPTAPVEAVPVVTQPEPAAKAPARALKPVEAAKPTLEPTNLYKATPQELEEALTEKTTSDKDKLLQAFDGDEAKVKEFNRLDRAMNNTMDTKRADEASKLFDEKFGNLTPKQQRLIYGIGETDAQADDIKEVLQAHGDVMPHDDEGWLGYMAAISARAVSVDDMLKVRKGEGSARAQAAFVRMQKVHDELVSRGINANELPQMMVDGLVQRAGWSPEHAAEIVGAFVGKVIKAAPPKPTVATKAVAEPKVETKALPSPRIADPVQALEAAHAEAVTQHGTKKGLVNAFMQGVRVEAGQEEAPVDMYEKGDAVKAAYKQGKNFWKDRGPETTVEAKPEPKPEPAPKPAPVKGPKAEVLREALISRKAAYAEFMDRLEENREAIPDALYRRLKVAGKAQTKSAAQLQGQLDGALEVNLDEPGGRFSRRDGVAEVSPEDRLDIVRDRVNEVTANWENAPKVFVARDYASLPKEERVYLEREGFDPTDLTMRGLHYQDRAYIFTDNNANVDDAMATLYHEALGHNGMQELFGARVDEALLDMYDTNQTVRRQVNSWMLKHGTEDRLTALHEVFAEASEGGEIKASLTDKLIAVVKEVGRMMGLKLAYSDREVYAILSMAHDVVTKNGITMVRQGRSNLTARPKLTDIPGEVKENLREGLENFKADPSGGVRRAVLKALTVNQIVEQYQRVIPSLRTYYRLMTEGSARVQQHTISAHKTLTEWQGLTTDRKQVGALLNDATFHQIDPRYGEDEGPNRNLSDEQKVVYHGLRQRYERMTPAGRRVMNDVLVQFSENLKKSMELFTAQIDDADVLTPAQKAEAKRETERFFKRIRVYFPLMRFGKFIAIGRSAELAAAEDAVNDAESALEGAKASGGEAEIEAAAEALKEARAKVDTLRDGDSHYIVSAFENSGQRNRIADQWRNAGLEVTVKNAPMTYEPKVDGVSSAFFEKVDASLEPYLHDPESHDTAVGLQQIIRQVYFQTLPEHHALKRNLKRKGVAGFDPDAERVFASASIRDAHYLSRLEFGQRTKSVLFDMEKEVKGQSEAAQDAYNIIRAQHAQSLQYVETPVQEKAANVAYLYFLGFSPAFAVVNLLQTPMVTGPMIAARYGTGRTSGALTVAMKQVATAQGKSFAKEGLGAEVNLNDITADVGERAMLNTLLERGVIDLTQVHDLGTQAGGNSRHWRGLMTMASFLPHHTEKLNRIASALAAYRLSKGTARVNDADYTAYLKEHAARYEGKESVPAPMSREAYAATEYAFETVENSHFNYSTENAPYWFKRMPLGKVVLQFRKYQQAMIYAVVKNAVQSVKGASVEDRRVARNTLTGLLGMEAIIAGGLGLPGASALMFAIDLVASAFDDDDDPWPGTEVVIRQWLADTFGTKMGEAIAHGAPRALGFPGDISARVGLGDLFNPIRVRNAGEEGRQVWANILAGVAGPSGTIVGDWFEAHKYFEQGDMMKGWELLVPKFARDVIKAARFGEEGVTTSGGSQVVSPKKIDGGDLVSQALGLTPARLAERYERQSAEEDMEHKLEKRRRLLIRRYAEAVLNHDHDEAVAAHEQVMHYNRERASAHEPIIKSSSLQQAIRRRRSDRLKQSGHKVLTKRERAKQRYGDFANDYDAED